MTATRFRPVIGIRREDSQLIRHQPRGVILFLRRAAFLAVLSLLMASCAGRSSSGAGDNSWHGDNGLPPVDWENPVYNGVEIGSVADAKLQFSPDVPDGLGPAERLVVTPGNESDLGREIGWVYDDPDYGRFVVLERVADGPLTEAEHESLAAASPGCRTLPATEEDEEKFGKGAGPTIECNYGDASLVSVRGGTRAILIVGEISTALVWIEPLDFESVAAYETKFEHPALEITVMGPIAEFQPSEALAIAEKI